MSGRMSILIVEDEAYTANHLISLLSEEIPHELEIHLASTEGEALRQIQASNAANRPYDIVLLDFLLPQDRGESPRVNESVIRALRESLQDTVIIHTSAYADDTDLMQFILKEAMRSPFGPRSAFLSKRDPSWPQQLLRLVEGVIQHRSANTASSVSLNFVSCFISYHHGDEEFVRLLYNHLKALGLQVWFAPESMKPGRKLKEEIDNAVRVYDKLLIVLSEQSMRSEWVATEIRTAIDEEKKTGVRKLFSIRLVEYDLIKNWDCFNADIGKDMAVELREYFILDFSRWRNPDNFQASLNKLLGGMKV